MNVIVGGRATGKTTKLIKYAAEHGGYIVCRSKGMCGAIADMARKMNLDIAFPLTYQEFLEKRYHGKGISKFYIDDVDSLLQGMTSVPIEIITINGGIDNA